MKASKNMDNCKIISCKEYKDYYFFLFAPEDWDGKELFAGGDSYISKSDGSFSNYAMFIMDDIDIGDSKKIDIKELMKIVNN